MNSENRLLVSYFTLRKLIGWMAILVPFILALLNWILFRGGSNPPLVVITTPMWGEIL